MMQQKATTSHDSAARRSRRASGLLVSLCASGRPDAAALARRLLTEGADVSATDSRGYGALTLSIQAADADLTRTLLDAGADPNTSASATRNPPLFWAIKSGHSALVGMLLGAKADPARRNAGGDTALMWACRGGWRDVAVALMAAAADSDARDRALAAHNDSGLSVLMCAASGGHADLIELLLLKMQPAETDAKAAVPLEVNRRDEHSRTALHFAARHSASCVEARHHRTTEPSHPPSAHGEMLARSGAARCGCGLGRA
jgi:ankyrin repeat protein